MKISLANMFRNEEFAKELIDRYGYLTNDDINDAIDLFGEDFLVCVKDCYGQREMISLYELKNMDKERDKNIKEVFIISDVFRAFREFANSTFI